MANMVYIANNMQRLISLSALIIACTVHVSRCLECEQNQNEQSTSFFETSGDISLTGLFDVYDENCSGPTPTGIHSMEMVATVVQILNSIHYVPGITIGLTLYEVCSYRSLDLQKALISFAAAQYCNNSTTPIAIYTTKDIKAKIAASAAIGLDVPIVTVGPIIDIDVHAESAVKFLTVNDVNVVDLLVAQDPEVVGRFEVVARANGLCLNRTVLAHDLGNLNDSFAVIIMANGDVIESILESSSKAQVSHFIIIPLDGPLPPKPDFEDGSYVFQAYGSCPFVNNSGVANATDSYGSDAGQAVSAQFVQTAADVLRAVDAYGDREAAVDADGCSGRNASNGCVATTNRSSTAALAAEAVGYGIEDVKRVLDKLLLLGGGGEYNVTLVHVTEYGGRGETVGAYVQDSDGVRRLRLDGGDLRPYLNECVAETCPTCSPPPEEPRAAWLTWKQDAWTASTLTVCAVGAICAVCAASFILFRVCKKDVMEGNPTFSFVLIAGTLLTYAGAVPFAVRDGSAYPRAACYAKLFGSCSGCAVVFSAMLARSLMIAACDCDTSFMSHVNGYLQTSLCAFALCVQLALMLQFAAVHAVLPSSDLCRVFVRGNLFLASLSYDALLLVLLCAATPFVFRSKRNYREGACFAVAAYLSLAVWLCWCAAYVVLPAEWSDTCVMVGLTGTATAVVVAVFIPRTYLMTFGIVRERIASSLPSLGYGRAADCGVADVNYRSTQALYDSVRVHTASKCGHVTGFNKGQSNPNYYSPAGSQVLSVPCARSRPLTPVNEYDVPPSPDHNRITRF